MEIKKKTYHTFIQTKINLAMIYPCHFHISPTFPAPSVCSFDTSHPLINYASTVTIEKAQTETKQVSTFSEEKFN